MLSVIQDIAAHHEAFAEARSEYNLAQGQSVSQLTKSNLWMHDLHILEKRVWCAEREALRERRVGGKAGVKVLKDLGVWSQRLKGGCHKIWMLR
jgi:hypothetical protein